MDLLLWDSKLVGVLTHCHMYCTVLYITVHINALCWPCQHFKGCIVFHIRIIVGNIHDFLAMTIASSISNRLIFITNQNLLLNAYLNFPVHQERCNQLSPNDDFAEFLYWHYYNTNHLIIVTPGLRTILNYFSQKLMHKYKLLDPIEGPCWSSPDTTSNHKLPCYQCQSGFHAKYWLPTQNRQQVLYLRHHPPNTCCASCSGHWE